MTATHLAARAVICIASDGPDEDVRGFLQGLVTNDVTQRLPVYAALLSAQGKTMFDFLIWDVADLAPEGDHPYALLLDCEADAADELVKRLSLYRLRRKITIARDPELAVHWSPDLREGATRDPRLSALGYRWIAPASPHEAAADEAWRAQRLSLGVPETRAELGDILWLETNAVELNGVDFGKGCYIGQENTARMNWRQKVNRRLVVVPLEASDEKRRKVAYSDLDCAVDHLRVADLDPDTLPEWQRAALVG